jgi:nickel transport protein
MGALGLLAAFLGAPPARAHEVDAEVVRGRAVAVRGVYPGGGPLADASAEVFSPAEPGTPSWRGRTDRNGWVAFLPDVPGRWRVRIVDAQGHALDAGVEVASLAGVAAEGATGGGHEHDHDGGQGSRLLLGAAAIASIFAVLYVVRRRGSP